MANSALVSEPTCSKPATENNWTELMADAQTIFPWTIPSYLHWPKQTRQDKTSPCDMTWINERILLAWICPLWDLGHDSGLHVIIDLTDQLLQELPHVLLGRYTSLDPGLMTTRPFDSKLNKFLWLTLISLCHRESKKRTNMSFVTPPESSQSNAAWNTSSAEERILSESMVMPVRIAEAGSSMHFKCFASFQRWHAHPVFSLFVRHWIALTHE